MALRGLARVLVLFLKIGATLGMIATLVVGGLMHER